MERFTKERNSNPDEMEDFRLRCGICGFVAELAISAKWSHPLRNTWERATDQASTYGWRHINGFDVCRHHFKNSFNDTLTDHDREKLLSQLEQ